MQDNKSAWLNFASLPREHGGLGLAPHQAAGLVGNLVKESGPNLPSWGPTGDNGTAHGTAQWRNERFQGLQDFAASKGLDYRSMEAQQAFMRHELDGPENRAYRAITAASSPEEAASAFNKLYERSADNTGGREREARALMQSFGGSAPEAQRGNAMAFSPMGGSTPPPDNGFLGQLGLRSDFMTGSNGGYGLAHRAGRAGAALMAIDNPKGAAAINEGISNDDLLPIRQAMVTQKAQPAQFEYDPKSGTFFRTVNGRLETQQNPNAVQAAHEVKPSALKELSKNEEKYGAISQISTEGAEVLEDLSSGKLDLGMLRNAENSGRNMAGMSNEQSRAYARYKQFIQKLANTEMLKANGVQTEGDAFRVMQEIAAGGANYDTAAAKEAISKLLLRNKEAVTGNGRTILNSYAGAYGADNPALTPFVQKFDGYGKTFTDIDSRLERLKKPAPASAPAPAAKGGPGGFRVIKSQY